MNLAELFPLIYCMNMDYRPDRWVKAQKEFSKLEITANRVSGIPYNDTADKTWNGRIGCGLTHFKILQMAKEQNQNVLVFEDDAIFINNFRVIIPQAIKELPDNWDMFYLGANVCRSIFQISDTLGKLTHAQSTHAYGANKNFLDKILSYEGQKFSRVIDQLYGDEIVPGNNCYITIPMVSIQGDDFSDIEGKKVNYSSWMEHRFQDQLVRMK